MWQGIWAAPFRLSAKPSSGCFKKETGVVSASAPTYSAPLGAANEMAPTLSSGCGGTLGRWLSWHGFDPLTWPVPKVAGLVAAGVAAVAAAAVAGLVCGLDGGI